MLKQFLQLDGKDTMLQATLNRLSALDTLLPLIICNEEHRFIAAHQLRQVKQLDHNTILEPVGRNTAPAIALAALTALEHGNDLLLLVLAADHVIENTSGFHKAVQVATPQAEADKLVTFGIVPSAPETGYGYIRRGAVCGDSYVVSQFVEKPNITTAKHYVSSGEYYWNSGMFMFKASVYLAELKQH